MKTETEYQELKQEYDFIWEQYCKLIDLYKYGNKN